MKPIFPASYSTLHPDALSDYISANYATGKVQCRLLVRGVGDTYLVESADDRFIMRIYRSSHRNLAQIKEEVALLQALDQAAVPVSYPIEDKSGEIIQHFQAAEGERHAVLFSYAPGASVRTMSEQQLRNFGREMARFHTVSAGISNGGARWNFDTATTLFRPLELLKPGFAEDAEGYAWLQQAAQKAADKLGELNMQQWPKGYCHFDFLPKNFHFDGDAITFFDFDFMGQGPLINDVMTFWQHLSLDVFRGGMSQENADKSYVVFLEGYREQRPLAEEELSAVPYLAPGFWLFYMGFHTTHDQFSTFTQPVFLKSYLGIMKNIVEKYWDQ